MKNTYKLSLADGSNLTIKGDDSEAKSFVSKLAAIMQLQPILNSNPKTDDARTNQFTVSTKPENKSTRKGKNSLVHLAPLTDKNEGIYINAMKLSTTLAIKTQTRGSILIHGALAEWKGKGVILAAPGGTGKTTASNRLPKTWYSHCDDTTLVVKDKSGNYFAHPWPTWSRFLWGGPGGTWNVQKPVPLKGIFFLSRAKEDKVEAVGIGQGAAMLVQSAKQAANIHVYSNDQEKSKAQIEKFNNICKLVKKIPVNLLHISLTGSFWEEIEKIL